MQEQYFGHKELYEVVLRAKNPMQFGDRYIEADEPVLYFDNVNMSLLTEQSRPIFARGGWANMPRVIWDDRSEVQFQMIEGVMSSVGMSILLSANVLSGGTPEKPLYINKKEMPQVFVDPELIDEYGNNVTYVYLTHNPIPYPQKKTFIYEFDRKAIQQKIYGQMTEIEYDGFDQPIYKMLLYQDKNLTKTAENNRKYVIDYYYKYEDEAGALIYSVQKERFNGLFTLEAKFYSQDENEGYKYTNVLYMPKVRVVSPINLRLGERADPTVSTFNIIGLPETVGESKNLIMEITRLGKPDNVDI